jgi:hypothetical protein
MSWRDFIAFIGGVPARPLAARAHQSAIPVIHLIAAMNS